MKALPIVWAWPEEFSKHIVMICPFHTEMNYIGMLTNHKAKGSGYEEILFESQLVTSGCLKHVLSGKAFAKSIFCLKTTVEALERLLIEVFIEEHPNMDLQPESLINVILNATAEAVNNTAIDLSTADLIKAYTEYQVKVRNGHLGKTAQFRMAFVDNAKNVLLMIMAVKTNNRKLLHRCMGEMAALFFAYDDQNYSR